MFLQAGTMKLFAFPAGIPPNGGTVPWMSEMGLAGLLETFGGGLLLEPLGQGRGVWIRSGEATQLETAPAAVV